jgi:hypothetical protein
MIMSADNKTEETTTHLSPAELKLLKEKLRHITWSREAVLREIALIQKLRLFFPRD